MLKDARNLLWLVPLAALLTMPLWKPMVADFLSPARKVTVASGPAMITLRPQNTSEMRDVRFEQNKNGGKEWLLSASRLYRTGNDADMRLEDVKALFFGSGGEHEETHIKSQKATYNAATKKITLRGNVFIQNDRGYEMRTDSLEYLAEEKKIRTTSAVNIHGNNITVRGNRLLYDTITGNYIIAGNVLCRIW